VVSPEKVARAIVKAFDHPRRELNVGVTNTIMVLGFRLLPGVFDLLVGPMMRLLAQGRSFAEPGPGNVFEPRPGGEAVHGRWPQVWGG
jgi:hypothetical protein